MKTKDKLYLDIYSIPSFDYHDNLGVSPTLALSEFNLIVENLYFLLKKLEKEFPHYSHLIKISRPLLISNISNFVRLSEIDKQFGKDYELEYSTKADFEAKAGNRNLGQGYVQSFFSRTEIPKIKHFLKGRRSLYRDLGKSVYSFFNCFGKKSVVYNPNSWVIQHLESESINVGRVFDSFFWPLSYWEKHENFKAFSDKDLTEFVDKVFSEVVNYFELIDAVKTNKLQKVITEIIEQSNKDYNHCKKNLQNKNVNFQDFFTGTSGNYKVRVISSVLQELGVKIHSFMHSGAIAHVDYKFDPRTYIEYEIPDFFYVFNLQDVDFLNKKIKEKSDLGVEFRSMSKKNAAEKVLKYEHVTKSNATKEPRGKSVLYIDVKFNGGFQYFGMDDDLKKISYENKLFELLEENNLKILFKNHPKGIKKDKTLYLNKFPNIEFIEDMSVKECVRLHDVSLIVFKMVDSTAFNELLNEDIPAIIVSEDQKQLLTDDARELLKNRVSFVDVSYRNGIAEINKQQLVESLDKQYTFDNCFTEKYQ